MSTFDRKVSTMDLVGAEELLRVCYPEAFPALRPQFRKELSIPNGLVVSRDDAIRSALAEVLLQCGVAPLFASSVEDAAWHMAGGDLHFIVCQDRLPDGKYEDLLLLKQEAGNSSPLIVISRTGEWQEYFEALDIGAQDYLPFPLIPGELQRVIGNFLDRARASNSRSSLFGN